MEGRVQYREREGGEGLHIGIKGETPMLSNTGCDMTRTSKVNGLCLSHCKL